MEKRGDNQYAQCSSRTVKANVPGREDRRHSISQMEKLRPEQVYVLFRQLTGEKLLEPIPVPIRMLFLPPTSNKGFVTSCKNKIFLNFHYSNKKKIHAIVGIWWLHGQADWDQSTAWTPVKAPQLLRASVNL